METKSIRVLYFAALRDGSGRSEECVQTTARTPVQLYQELCKQYDFGLEPDHLRVAVNEAFASWTQPLHDGDVIVFIPPVAGG